MFLHSSNKRRYFQFAVKVRVTLLSKLSPLSPCVLSMCGCSGEGERDPHDVPHNEPIVVKGRARQRRPRRARAPAAHQEQLRRGPDLIKVVARAVGVNQGGVEKRRVPARTSKHSNELALFQGHRRRRGRGGRGSQAASPSKLTCVVSAKLTCVVSVWRCLGLGNGNGWR